MDKRVLVADDEPFAQNILKMLYGSLKVECVMVANGKEALEAY
jgi:CheY-like chemotaxis protein